MIFSQRILTALSMLMLFGTLNAATLLLEKTTESSSVESGQEFTYTIRYTCQSTTDNCENVVLKDHLPPELDYVAHYDTADVTSSGFNAGDGNVTWTFNAVLAAGSTGELMVIAKFKEGTTANGTVAHNIVVGPDDPASNDLTASAVSRWTMDKRVIPEDGDQPAGSVYLDRNTTYHVEFCSPANDNIGGLNLNGAVLVDTLPADATYVDSTGGGVYNGSAHTVTWNLGNLPVTASASCYGANVIVVFSSADVNESDSVTNSLRGSGTPEGESPLTFGPVNVTSTAVNYVFHAHPTPALSKSAVAEDSGENWIRDDRLGAPENITYTLTPQNNGNVDLLDYNLSDTLPTEVEPYELTTGAYNQPGNVALYINDGSGWTLQNVYDRATSQTVALAATVTAVALDFGTVSPEFAPTTASQLRVRVKTPGSLSIGDVISNCANVNAEDNASNSLAPVQACADISVRDNYSVPRVSKSNDTGSRPVAIGSSVTYTLTVENATEGTGTMDKPIVMDLLPEGLTYNGDQVWTDHDSGAAAPAFEAIDDYNGTGRTLLRWIFADGTTFARGRSGDLTFSVTVENTAGNGTVVNTGYITTNSTTNPYDCGSTGQENDPHDLDGDGITSADVLCYRRTPIDILDTTSLSSQKWVKGVLDADFTRYPNTGYTIGGGNADYKLIVKNNGNVAVRNLEVLDILPFEGDTGVTRTDENRTSKWRPNLAGPIDMGALSSVSTVYYSVAGNPCRAADGYVAADSDDCEDPEWSTTPPGDISQVYSVKIVFDSSVELEGNESLEFTWPMLAPVDSPIGETAWNSFAFKAERVDGVSLLPAEPIKVGIEVSPDINNSYGDRIWLDIDRDGIQDPGEPGVNGVDVVLWDVTNPVSPVKVQTPISSTDYAGNAGIYRFVNLPDGHTYKAGITLPADYQLTLVDQGANDGIDSDFSGTDFNTTGTTTLSGGTFDPTWDAGIYSDTKAAVGDYVWYENDFDGIQDIGELPVVGMRVKLYKSDGTYVDVTTTNKQGRYLFYNLEPGDYYVQFDLPYGYGVIEPDQGSDDAVDSDANLTTHRTAVFTLNGGDVDLTRDAGIYLDASIGNYVWHDRDGDGIQDSGEPGIGGVTVTLNREVDAATFTTVTEANGSYSFEHLHPGDYNITFDWTAVDTHDHPFAVTVKNAGSNTDRDSDGILNLNNTQQALTQTTTLDLDEDDPTWDLGLYIPASLGDKVWLDNNGNGRQDGTPDEYGVAGVTVNLYDRNNGLALVDTNITDSAGNYLFDDLRPGRYQVEVVPSSLPANHVFTLRNQVSNSVDSDVNTGSGRSNTGTLVSDEDDMSWDAGIYEPASLGNYIWYDADANGIQDAGEGNISGLPIDLYYGHNSVYGYGVSAGVPTVNTDANGVYMFTDLRPDTYYIQVDLSGTDYLVTLLNIGSYDTDNDLDSSGKSIDLTLTSGENNTSLDGGLYIPATLGNFVWDDMNRNGIQDPGEPGIANVTMELLNAVGAPVQNVQTDSSGFYRFENIRPGDYSVRMALPAGYVQSPKDAVDSNDTNDSDFNSSLVTVQTHLDHNETDLSWDAGLYRYASIGDRVWEDLNANGIQDNGEPGIEGVEINLTRVSDGAKFTTTTDGNGDYAFTGLEPDDYNITFDWSGIDNTARPYLLSPSNQGGDGARDSDGILDAGQSQKAYTVNTTLVSNENDVTWDLGLYKLATYGDRVWHDVNGNGEQDAMEPGIAGVKVTLYNDSNGMLVGSMDTNVTGEYRFTGLVPDDYHAVFDLADSDLAGFVATLRDVNGVDLNDSDADRATGVTVTTELESGEDDISWDLGVYQPASIGDLLFMDTDANGIQDDSAGGVDGIGVSLYYDSNDSLVASTTTSGGGNYLFGNLRPDSYYVHFDLGSTDYLVTLLDMGGNEVLDSDIDVMDNNNTTAYVLSSGEDNRSVDGGVYEYASLGDYVWDDLNANGLQDAGENGIGMVTVYLFDDSDNQVDMTTTENNGSYRFDNLVPGTYYVQFDLGSLPADYVVTERNASNDGNDTLDSDANRTTGITHRVTLTSGEHNPTLDMGAWKPASLGNHVWVDTDADGTQNESSTGLADVNVTAYHADGSYAGSDVTAADGSYLIDNLKPGSYYVEFNLSSPVLVAGGYRVSGADLGGDDEADSDANATNGRTQTVTLASGEYNPTLDMGVYILATYGDRVWHDVNGNGEQDAMEPGIAGVKVTLYNDSNGTLVGSMDTNVTGEYRFTGLVPDDYHAIFDLADSDLAGFVATLRDVNGVDLNDSDADRATGVTVTTELESGEDDISWDLGVYQPASIGDYVWYDSDADGIQDGTEVGVVDINVSLYDGTGTLIASQLTDGSGNYLFDDLRPDDYYVGIDVSGSDYLITLLDQGDDSNDSDIISSDRKVGSSAVTALSDNEHNRSLDAGLYEYAKLGDYVWEDLDEDGIQDAGEPGVDDITINLYDENGTFLGSTVTTGGGQYEFTDLEPGSYYVEIDKTTLPPEYGLAFANRGGDDTKDSDANVTTGRTVSVTLFGGDDYRDFDFGILEKRLELNLRAYCLNDAPYVEYNISLIGLEPDGLNATMTWANGDNSEQRVETGLPLSDSAHLWYGSGVDGSGRGNLWPGWQVAADGTWEKIPSDWLRWNPDGSDADVNVTLSVNPHTSVTVHYPPATATCNPNPEQYGHVFDPPSATKTVNNEGWPEIEWKMVWINDSNAMANRVHIEDPLEENLTFVPGSLECNVTGASVTDNCEFDSVLNAVVWDGAIAPDPGAVDEESASNEVVIVFRTSVENNATEVFNQARVYWDQDGDGNVDMNRSVPSDDPDTTPLGDPTVAKKPIRIPTVSEWGRMALMVLFMASAYAVLYRRREEG